MVEICGVLRPPQLERIRTMTDPKDIKAAKTAVGVAKPHLTCVPPTLLDQWVQALMEVFPSLIAHLYHSNFRARHTQGNPRIKVIRQQHLNRKNWIFSGDEDLMNYIVLTTPQKMAVRHGPAIWVDQRLQNLSGSQTQRKKHAKQLNEQATEFDTAPKDFDAVLNGCFGSVTID
ncbi:MAG: hypothetical protein Q9157_003422 [Trypethelium eluteriae]